MGQPALGAVIGLSAGSGPLGAEVAAAVPSPVGAGLAHLARDHAG